MEGGKALDHCSQARGYTTQLDMGRGCGGLQGKPKWGFALLCIVHLLLRPRYMTCWRQSVGASIGECLTQY